MKIFEVTSLQEAAPPPFISQEMIKGTGEYKGQGKLPVTAVKVVGTDAEDLELDGAPIKGKLFVIGDWQNWDQQKQASHFYIKLPSGMLQRVDDKKFSTSVVSAMDVANQPPGFKDRVKGKVSSFLDPNDPERAGYNVLQKPGALTGKTATTVTRGLAGIDNLGRKVVDYFRSKGDSGGTPPKDTKNTGPGYRTTDYHNYSDGEQPTGPKSGGRQKGGKSQTDSAKRQRELRRIKQLQSGDIVTYTYGDNKTGEGELRGYNPQNKKEFVLKMVDPFNPNAPKDPMGNPLVSVPTNLVFKKQGSKFDPVKGWQKRGDREDQTPRNQK